jgi:Ring finger domain
MLPVLLSLLLCWGEQVGIVFVTAQASSRASVCSLDRFETEWIRCRQVVGGQTEKTCELVNTATATSVVNNDNDESFLSSREEEEAIASSSSLNNTTTQEEDTGTTAGAAAAVEQEVVVVLWPSEPFRICDCTYVPLHTDYYCPMPATDYCRFPRPRPYYQQSSLSSTTPICLRRPSRLQEFAMSVWPVLLITFLAMLVCSVCSRSGQRSICLIVAMCLPCLQTVYANYLLRYRPRQASLMIRRWIRRRGIRFTERYNEIMNGEGGDGSDDENGRDDSPRRRRRNNAVTAVEETLLRDSIAYHRNGRPHMLRLATRIFRERDRSTMMMMQQQQQQQQLHHTESSDEVQSIGAAAVGVQDTTRGDDDLDRENDADLDGCMICFGPLCDGDRVGSLQCKHVFHVHCLKTWYARSRRSNRCCGWFTTIRMDDFFLSRTAHRAVIRFCTVSG